MDPFENSHQKGSTTSAANSTLFPPPLPCPRSCKLALEHTGKVHAASPVTKDRDGKRVRWGAEGSPCMC